MDILGVDIGGVIIGQGNDSNDTSFFSDNFLATPAMPGVFAELARLVDTKFGDQVYLVSKCRKRVQDRSLAWLQHRRFFELTGISPDNVRFCRKRPRKAAIARKLRLTHFVDDRLEVLGYLDTVVENLYLFRPKPDEIQRHRQHLPRVRIVQSWTDLSTAILGQTA